MMTLTRRDRLRNKVVRMLVQSRLDKIGMAQGFDIYSSQSNASDGGYVF